MKDGKSILFALAVPASLVLGMWCTKVWIKASDYEDRAHHDKCVTARVLFFDHCLKLDQRAECETMWSQKRGIVFDGEAEKPWTDEIDCSREVK